MEKGKTNLKERALEIKQRAERLAQSEERPPFKEIKRKHLTKDDPIIKRILRQTL